MEAMAGEVATSKAPPGAVASRTGSPGAAEMRCLLASARRIAVVGMTDDPESAAFLRAERLMAWGLQLAPVHSRCGKLFGCPCYERLADIPGEVDVVLVLPASDVPLAALAEEAIARRARAFWVEDGSIDERVAAALTAAGIAVVEGRSFQVEIARQR
jgi:predicted CoA-binding protein